ncbi:MAG: HD domain-containing protein [Clostridiales bacterium]|nr:HD domain-containing protein [Clostridiales bacterium]
MEIKKTAPETEIPDYVMNILELIGSSGCEAFVAGGAVRDTVLGKKPHDYDIATSARPDEIIGILKKAGIEYFDNGARHGTVTAVTEQGNVEVTTFREDGHYSDLRRPDEVVFKATIEDDVRRRDFTVNAMYMDRYGVIHDPVGGKEDCENRLIRAVGNAGERFGEDALRILRAVRFCSRLGFEIESGTLRAMEEHAAELKQISAERVAAELTGIVTGRYAAKAIRTCWKIMSVIIPEIGTCRGFEQRSKYHDRDVLEHTLDVLDLIPYTDEEGKDPELAMAALFHDLGKPACFWLDANGTGHMKGHPRISTEIAGRVLNELKFPKQFITDVCLLVKLHDTYMKADKIEVHRFMCKYPEEILNKLKILQRADILAHSPFGQNRIKRLEELNAISEELKASGAVFDIRDLDIDGNDIIVLGVCPGPDVGRIMSQLFEDYIEERCYNNKENLINEAKRIISEQQI